jgi:hypothetical protein
VGDVNVMAEFAQDTHPASGRGSIPRS